MKNGSRASGPEELAIIPPITRREALALLGGAALSVALAGCGGGGGGGTAVAGDSGRTSITGDLTAQFNQFSAAADRVGVVWQGSSPALDALQTQVGRAISRAPADVKVFIQALNIGMNGTRSAYERLCTAALALDDLGAAASTVTKNNSLPATNALNNEQWLAAMIAQNYAAVSVTGMLFVIQQVAGISEAGAWVLTKTSDADKLVAYGLVADVFNTWVNALCAAGNITPVDDWKMDLSNAVTAANVGTKLNDINTIIPKLPFSPGYRKLGATLAQTDDESLGATGVQNFIQTFTGVLAQLTLSTTTITDTFPQTVDPTKTHYDVTARLGTTGVGQRLAGLTGGLAAAQSSIDAQLASTDGTLWPGVTGASATAQIHIIGSTYGFLQALATALITTQSALGSLITGNQALQFLTDLENTIAANGSDLQKALWAQVQTDRDRLRKQQLLNGAAPTTRRVDVVTVTGRAELDQIAASGIINTTITVSTPDICAMDPKTTDTANYRVIISGLKKLPNCPRTFRNVLICIAGLLYEIGKQFPDTVNPTWNANTISFFSNDFARALRREPQASFAEVPAITSASLLCSGVGFIPSKTLTPMNLATIAKMPDLKDITGLVGGVPINVH